VTLTPMQMNLKMDEHFAYEGRDDVEGVLATLAPDATHDVVGWPLGPSRGREAARSFYETMFADLAESRVTPLRRLHGEGFLVDESLWQGKAAGRPFGLEGRGRPLEFRLLHVVEFTESGQIAKEQVWLDVMEIMRQLPQ
jgi:predicted ester cyclase